MRHDKILTINTDEARDIFRLASGDYRYNADVLCEDDARIRAIKRVMDETLSEPDRNLLILYSEVGSMVKVAEMMQVSKNTLRKNINRIRAIIKGQVYAGVC